MIKKQIDLLDKMNDDTTHMLSLDTITEYVANLKELLSSSSFLEQKSFLRTFVKRIELSEPQVIIDYTIPLPINGLTTAEEVLCINKLGSPNLWFPGELAIRTIPRILNAGRPSTHLSRFLITDFERPILLPVTLITLIPSIFLPIVQPTYASKRMK